MAMNVNGINHVTPPNEQVVVEQQQKIESKVVEEQKAIQQQVIQEAHEKADEERAQREEMMEEVRQAKYVMSESDMRELLVLMGSRGNSQAVEKLIESVKNRENTSA